MKLPFALFACVASTQASAAFVPTPQQKATDFDVVVYGGTPGGVQAALAAANEGLSVLLATPQPLLGGMMSGGLGETDVGNAAAIGGASLAFFLDVCRAYGDVAPTKPCFKFEPHVAQGVFEHLVAASPRVTVRLNTTLLETTQGVAGVATVSFVPTNAAEAAPIFTAAALAGVADVVSARAFIDATYEGDLIAAAGIATAVGREAVTTYNESHAGVLAEPSSFGSHQFCPGVDAIDHTTGLPLPFISHNPPGAVGSGDAMVQAYNFRLTMTRNTSNLVPFMQPANYRDADWEIARRFIAKCNKTSFSSLMNLSPIPNAKTDTNNNGAVSTDFIGGSWAWPAATPLARRAIYTAHREYTEGFMWFLQHDASLPASIRAEAVTWGLAADEYDGKGWSPQLYVREGRRMVSDFVFRQQDRQTDIRKPDSIGLFSYNIDSHHAQRYVNELGHAVNEGDFELYGGPMGQMPYRVLVPAKQSASGKNVLAPVPLSASHMGYGCLRLEPQLMILGQAAGVAAAQALADGVAVQDIDVAKLQARLRVLGAIIDLK